MPRLMQLLVLVGLMCGTQLSSAAITVMNDPTIPSGTSPATDFNNLTVDSATNLQWLDVNWTVGQSYIDIVGDGSAEAVAMYPGFRYATAPEVLTFWLHNGVTPGLSFNAGDIAATAALVEKWGATEQTSFESDSVAWISALPVNTIDIVEALSTATSGEQLIASNFDYLVSGFPTVGSALVREVSAVPEPASMTLWSLLAVAGLAWCRVRRS